MNKIVFISIILICIISCNNEQEFVKNKLKEKANPRGSFVEEHFDSMIVSLDSLATNQPTPIDNDLIEVVIQDYAPISEIPFYPEKDFEEEAIIYDAEILITGNLHKEEASTKLKNKKWFGLFQSKNRQFRLKQVEPSFTTVFDPIVDESEDFSTGVKVEIASEDSVILLFSNLDYLKNRIIESIDNTPSQILPSESFEFPFKGKAYKLSAWGDVEIDPYSEQEYVSGDYELFLEYTEYGKTSKNLVSAAHYLDDSMIKIIFIGDIDGDDKIDLIIDNSPKYNAYTPTLYLSSVAEQGQLLKIVGVGSFLGC